MNDPVKRPKRAHSETPPPPASPPRRGLFARARSSFLTGIVVILPVGLTIWLLWTLAGWVDGFVMPLVPQRFHPDYYVGVNLRGAGIIIFLIFTIMVGWVAKGLIGRSIIRSGERLVDQMPIVRSIYSGAKQIATTVFAESERKFEHACLIQYPRRGAWAIGFVSTAAKGEIAERPETGGNLLSVFVPTTPNPTSGFLLYISEEDVVLLDMTVEDAAKLVISAGLVYPNPKDPSTPVPASEL